MTRFGRMFAMGAGLTLLSLTPFSVVKADQVGGKEEIIVPPRAAAPTPEPVVVTKEVPVTAPPPPFVEIQRHSVAAGIGFSWGGGTVYYEGQQRPFTVKGLRVGDVGAARMVAEGEVQNLEHLSDFAGHYVAVEAGLTAGKGAGALTMRNEHGVVISLQSELEGVDLTLGAEGFTIALE